jgi:hypothetical protein
MPSSTFETAVLTTALYGIMLIALNMFSVVSQWVFVDSMKVRLGEVANQLAYEIASIYSMCRQSRSDLSFFKPIEIPPAISEEPYAVELRKIRDVWYVVVYLETNRAINASSPIWEEPGVDVLIGPPEGMVSFTIYRTHGSYTINCINLLRSGTAKPVVWASRSNGEIRVGLGYIEEIGG